MKDIFKEENSLSYTDLSEEFIKLGGKIKVTKKYFSFKIKGIEFKAKYFPNKVLKELLKKVKKEHYLLKKT